MTKGFRSMMVAAIVSGLCTDCTPAERATASADAKVVENLAMRIGQEICANKVLDAAVEALIPMSPAVEEGVMKACQIEQALQPLVHAKVVAHAVRDAGCD